MTTNQNQNPLSIAQAAGAAAVAAKQSADLSRSFASKAHADSVFIQNLLSQVRITSLWRGGWGVNVTYKVNEFVDHSDVTYMSLVNGNLGHTPDSSPSQWQTIAGGGSGTISTGTGLTGNGSDGSPAKLADIAAHTFLARKTNSVGTPENVTPTEVTALLDVATTGAKGLMSAADKTLLDTRIGPLLFIPNYHVYANPLGNDTTGDGTLNNPYLTAYKAAQAVVSHGGGTLHYTDGTQIGNPEAGMGLCFRGDGLSVPGWLGDVPMVIEGTGNASGGTFHMPGAASLYGSSNSPLTPMIWTTATAYPKVIRNVFSNLIPGSAFGLCSPIRIGWDYNRNNDGSPRQLTVTNASRAAGSTTFTVTLPAGYTIISGKRGTVGGVPNTVTLNVQLPSNLTYSPWFIGSKVRVVTSDATFPSVDATVTDQSDAFAKHTTGEIVTLSYVQAGDPVASFQPITGGTVTGHGVQAKDRVFVGSSSSEFPTCWGMRCTSATVDTITVRDPYGYAPRSATASADNIGYLLKQERGRVGSVAPSMYNVVLRSGHFDDDNFSYGPSLDFGSADAVGLKLSKCYLEGFTCANPTDDQIDRDRVWCGLLADPGVGVSSAGVYESYDNASSDGNVRFYSGISDNVLKLDGWLQDTGLPLRVGPCVQIMEGNQYSKVILNNIQNADAFAGQPAIEDLAGLGAGRLVVGGNTVSGNNNLVYGACHGPQLMDPRLWLNPLNVSASPWVRGWNGLWPGVTLTSPHVGPNRKDAIGSARTTNLWTPLANWESATPFPAGVTVTSDATGPFGQSNAIKIVAAGTSQIVVGDYPHELPGSGTGGYVAFGMWVNRPSGSGLESLSVNIGQYAGLQIGSRSALVVVPHIVGGAGWQWITGFGKVTAAPDRHYAQLLNVPAGETNIWGPTLMYLPAETGDNDAYEWFNTFCAQPVYLPQGMTGTFEGDKFIAHGGLGVSSDVLSAPSGASKAISNWWPLLGADGTTVLGYLPLAATVGSGGFQSASGRAASEKAGANLVDNDQTLSPGVDHASVYVLPPATLTGGRNIDLADTGCQTADYMQVVIQQTTGNFNNSIRDAAGTPLVTFNCEALGHPVKYSFYHNGTHWQLNIRSWID